MCKGFGMFTAVAIVAGLAGCSTAPKTPEEKRSLQAEADATIVSMTNKDASLRNFINNAYGYAVFPNIGKGGVLVGGAYGRGIVYEQNRPIGYVELNQGSVGAQLGGQTYAQMIVFENENSLARLKAGNFDIGGEVSAVALKAGGAKEARFEGGIAVFQMPKGGLMAAAAINGQKLNFQPFDGTETNTRSSTTRTTTTMEPTDRSTGGAQTASESAQQRLDRAADQATGGNRTDADTTAK